MVAILWPRTERDKQLKRFVDLLFGLLNTHPSMPVDEAVKMAAERCFDFEGMLPFKPNDNGSYMREYGLDAA